MVQLPVKERFGFRFQDRIRVVGDHELCGWFGRVVIFGKKQVGVDLTDSDPPARQATNPSPCGKVIWLSPDQIKHAL